VSIFAAASKSKRSDRHLPSRRRRRFAEDGRRVKGNLARSRLDDGCNGLSQLQDAR